MLSQRWVVANLMPVLLACVGAAYLFGCGDDSDLLYKLDGARSACFLAGHDKIAYIASDKEGNDALWMLDLSDDEAEPLLVVSGLGPSNPTFSPARGDLTYAVGGTIYSIRPEDGAEPQVVAKVPFGRVVIHDARWSPDGKRLAFAYQMWRSAEHGICLLEQDELEPEKLVVSQDREEGYIDFFSRFTWSADGTFLVFTKGTQRFVQKGVKITIDNSHGERNLWAVDVATHKLRQLTFEKESYCSTPCAIPGTNRVLFVKGPKASFYFSGEGTICVLNLDTGRQTDLIPSADSLTMSCSADGTRVAFDRNMTAVIAEMPASAETTPAEEKE